jgi:RNase P subunit RPR2
MKPQVFGVTAHLPILLFINTMAIRIVETKPDPSVIKQVICKNCGVKLEYLPIDAQHKTYTSFGDTESYSCITCLNCAEEITIKGC